MVNSILVLTVSIPRVVVSGSHLCESKELAETAVYVLLGYTGSHGVCIGNFMPTPVNLSLRVCISSVKNPVDSKKASVLVEDTD